MDAQIQAFNARCANTPIMPDSILHMGTDTVGVRTKRYTHSFGINLQTDRLEVVFTLEGDLPLDGYSLRAYATDTRVLLGRKPIKRANYAGEDYYALIYDLPTTGAVSIEICPNPVSA